MSTATMSQSAAVRARLRHPIIDSDSHIVEFTPAFQDYLKQVGGSEFAERSAVGGRRYGGRMTAEERRDRWVTRPPWWALPARNTLDRVTGSLPRLLVERLDEIAMDYLVLFPTTGLGLSAIADDETRRVSCRAFNEFVADIYGEYSDRLTVTAVIPMHTPAEALAELEHAHALGLKVAFIPAYVRRPIKAIAEKYPELAQQVTRIDTFGIDSEYDYDPVWAKCVELKLPIGFHSSGMGFTERSSPTTYMYNHIGHFAAAGEAVCKSLFFGGVTRRFPELRLAAMEGGVAWGCRLYADLIARWEKRGGANLENLDPSQIDTGLALELFQRYGGKLAEGRLDKVVPWLTAGADVDVATRDDFRACGIERAEDIRDLFVPNFFFGCEADDPTNAFAFQRKFNPFGVQIGAVLGTDIGHWDVTDMRTAVAEAYELVEREVMSEADFQALACDNAISLYASLNPEFFAGTVVAEFVREHLAGSAP